MQIHETEQQFVCSKTSADFDDIKVDNLQVYEWRSDGQNRFLPERDYVTFG